MKTYSIYLAGPITGCSYEEANDWRKHIEEVINPKIVCFSPFREKHNLLKNEVSIKDCYESDPLASQRTLFMRDYLDVMHRDLIFVNMLGAKIASIGTCFEIAWAHHLRKPIVLCMEKTGNIHDHSFVREACPFRVDSIEDGIYITEKILLPG